VFTTLITLAVLFADDPPAAPAGRPPDMAHALLDMAPWIVVALAFWYFFLQQPMRRERARQQALLAGVKKNDRVLTTSGILGVVTNVNKDARPPEVTLRIDETTNAKIRVALNTIAQILGDEPPAETASK
jgi:preprotein translocase subunit YajC